MKAKVVVNGIIHRVSKCAKDAAFNAISKENVRGLVVFINDIKRCESKEEELKRIRCELNKIKYTFSIRTGLNRYKRKKCIAKLIHIHNLGYNVDFGIFEALTMISSLNLSEKAIGYLFLKKVVPKKIIIEKATSIIGVLKTEISSSNPEFASLALTSCASIICQDLVDGLFDIVYEKFLNIPKLQNIYENQKNHDILLCISAMIGCDNTRALRAGNDMKPIFKLMSSPNPADEVSAIQLLKQLMIIRPSAFEITASMVIGSLSTIINTNIECFPKNDLPYYDIYHIYRPWTIVKLIRMLNYYKYDSLTCFNLTQLYPLIFTFINIIHRINSPDIFMIHAIIFEFVNFSLKSAPNSHINEIIPLAKMSINHSNIVLRGMVMENIRNILISYSLNDIIISNHEAIDILEKEHSEDIRNIMFDICSMACDKEKLPELVISMIDFILICSVTERQSLAFRAVLVAESCYTSPSWYVDHMILLIQNTGDYLSEITWSKIAKSITSNNELQYQSCKTLFSLLKSTCVNENLIKLGVYVLGIHGHMIAHEKGSSSIDQLNLFINLLDSVSSYTRAIVISSISKFLTTYPDLTPRIETILTQTDIVSSFDTEVQQRAIEVVELIKLRKAKMIGVDINQYLSLSTDVLNKNFNALYMDYRDINKSNRKYGNMSAKPTTANLICHSEQLKIYNKELWFKDQGVWFDHPLLLADISIGRMNSTTRTISITITLRNRATNDITDFEIEQLCGVQQHLELIFSSFSAKCIVDQTILLCTAKLHHPYRLINQKILTVKFKCAGNFFSYSVPFPLFTHHFILPKLEKMTKNPNLIMTNFKQASMTLNKEQAISIAKLLNFTVYSQTNTSQILCACELFLFSDTHLITLLIMEDENKELKIMCHSFFSEIIADLQTIFGC